MLDPGLTLPQLVLLMIGHAESLRHLCLLGILGRVVVHFSHRIYLVKVWSLSGSRNLRNIYWDVIVLIKLPSTFHLASRPPIITFNKGESSQSWCWLIETLGGVKLGRVCFTLHCWIRRVVASLWNNAFSEKLMSQALVTGRSIIRVPW